MSQPTISEMICQIFGNFAHTDDHKKIDVKPEHRLGGWDDHDAAPDLNEDSLDRVEIVMGIEDEFGLEIPDEDARQWKTVADVISYVERRKAVAP